MSCATPYPYGFTVHAMMGRICPLYEGPLQEYRYMLGRSETTFECKTDSLYAEYMMTITDGIWND